MKIKVYEFDFFTGKVVLTEREVPDPPSTPLMDVLKTPPKDEEGMMG